MTGKQLTMTAEHSTISIWAKIGYGILIPVLGFIGFQAALIQSTSGTGSWDGMGIAFGSIVLVPGLLITNGWILPLRWNRRSTVLLAGLGLPAVIALLEYLWLYGNASRWLINAAFVAPFYWIWAFVILMFLPLCASIIHAVAHRRKPCDRLPGS